jgi:hypothetical protein
MTPRERQVKRKTAGVQSQSWSQRPTRRKSAKHEERSVCDLPAGCGSTESRPPKSVHHARREIPVEGRHSVAPCQQGAPFGPLPGAIHFREYLRHACPIFRGGGIIGVRREGDAMESRADQIERESRYISRFQRQADDVSRLILNTDLPWVDIAIQIERLRQEAGRLFPRRKELFELVYVSRFKRLWEQWRVPAPAGSSNSGQIP